MDDYDRWYTKGWVAAQRSAELDAAEARFLAKSGEPWNGTAHNAFEDGWLDWAAGREKFHLRDCPDHDHCHGAAPKPTCEGMGAPLNDPEA